LTLPLFAAAWFLGFAAVGAWGGAWWAAGAVGAALAPVAAVIGGRRGAITVLLAALIALGGGWLFDGWTRRDSPDLAQSAGARVELEGTVDGGPEPGLTTVRYPVRVTLVSDEGGLRRTDGRVLVTLGQYTEWLPGDTVRLKGKLEAPENFDPEFDYRAYLARHDIVGTMYFPKVEAIRAGDTSLTRTVARARLRLDGALQRALPEPEASLASGIAFGQDQNLPADLQESFRDAGLAHITAVSGSNVALVAAFAFLIFVPVLGRYWAAAPATLTVAAYVALAGFEASVVRSGVMAGIYLGGLVLGRQQNGLAALALAGILMTAVDPGAATEAGFQLSFAATAGLIAFSPWLRWTLDSGLARLGLAGAVPAMLVQAAALSLAATLATLPVACATFGRVSLAAPLTNLIVEPLFVLVMPLTFATALLGIAWEPAGWAAGIVTYYPLTFTGWLAKTVSGIPGAAVDTGRPGGGAVAAVYALMGAAGWLAYRRFAPRPPDRRLGERGQRGRRVLFAGGIGLAVIVIARGELASLRGPAELRVDFLDIGQGDAALITTPGGYRVLVDSGPSGIGLARQLSEVLPHWDRRIDRVVLTHAQEDHVAGFPALFRRFDVHTSDSSGRAGSSQAGRLFGAEAPGPAVLHAGDGFSVDGVRFEVLWPPAGYAPANVNDASVVLRVTFGNAILLLTGDIEAPAQRALMDAEDVRATVLKVPHHGSKTSAPAFLAAVGADVAVISVGAANRFGHPADQTLAALGPGTVFRTDCNGRVTVRSDGRTVRTTVQRRSSSAWCSMEANTVLR
jgi:competence protein ComEC